MRASSTTSVLPLLLAGTLSLTGCLQKETTHTIYISASGITWAVIEKDVRSDEKRPADRLAEEQDYVAAADAGRHPVARALGALGAQPVTTNWLRHERPYSVLTQARFAGLRELALAILAQTRAQGDAWIERKGCETTFRARVDVESAPENEDTVLEALLEDLDRYRFVLAEGRFVSADGFTIGDDGVVAVPDPEKKAEHGVLTFALTWSDDPCVAQADSSSR
jgi:hypothetical protein